MPDYDDYAPILARAQIVFGRRAFALTQLAIEIPRRTAEIREAIDALVAAGQVERVEGVPITYQVKG